MRETLSCQQRRLDSAMEMETNWDQTKWQFIRLTNLVLTAYAHSLYMCCSSHVEGMLLREEQDWFASSRSLYWLKSWSL